MTLATVGMHSLFWQPKFERQGVERGTYKTVVDPHSGQGFISSPVCLGLIDPLGGSSDLVLKGITVP